MAIGLMRKTSFYALLGVPVDAAADEIKLAFKRRALQVHPDKGQGLCLSYCRIFHVFLKIGDLVGQLSWQS